MGRARLGDHLAVRTALEGGGRTQGVVTIVIGGAPLVFAMWWLYFDNDNTSQLTSMRRGFIFGYGHFVIYASAAAVGAGIVVALEVAGDHGEIGAVAVGYAVTVPVAIYVVSLWLQQGRFRATATLQSAAAPIVAGLLLLVPFGPLPVLLAGLLLVTLVALTAVHTPAESS